MTSKNRDLLPGQTPLFDMESGAVEAKKHRKSRKISVVPLEKTWPEVYGKPGSYVNVQERARLLITALGSFSARNSRMYFPYAAARAPYDKEIAERYEEDLPNWLIGAKINKKGYEELAKRSFWHATGLPALKGKGILRPGQIDPLGEIWWDDFEFFYKNKRRREERSDYIERLKVFLPEDNLDTSTSEEQAA